MRRLFILFSAVLITVSILTGCSGSRQQAGPQQQVNAPPPSQEQKETPAPGVQAPAAADPQKPGPSPQQPAAQKPAAETPATGQIYSMKVGSIFPPFTLQDLDGVDFHSKDIISSNKVTVINFWGTFCGPCINELPDLEALREIYDGRGLGVIGIVVDSRNKEEAKRLAAQTGTNYTHLLDNGTFSSLVMAVPHTVIVDSKGKVLSSVTGKRSLSQFTSMVNIHLN